MEISGQLLRPFIKKMESEWRDLYQEIAGQPREEIEKFISGMEQRMRQLEKFRVAALEAERSTDSSQESQDLRESLRFLKLDLRTARRKWRRHLVSKIRTRKRQERATHAASIVK